MFKRKYKVLDKDKDILDFEEYQEGTDPYSLQGSAISALFFLDRIIDHYKLSYKGIKGILFGVSSFEFAREFDDMHNPNIFLITDDSIDISIRAYINTEIGFLGILKTKDEIMQAIKDERAFLIYGDDIIIKLVGEENLAKNYIPKYVAQEPDI